MKIQKEDFIYIESVGVWMTMLMNGQVLYDYWGRRYKYDEKRGRITTTDYSEYFPYRDLEMKLKDFTDIGMYIKK